MRAPAMTRLKTVTISRDSADQRAGRAGRIEPGVAYRLWSRIEHGTRPAHRAAGDHARSTWPVWRSRWRRGARRRSSWRSSTRRRRRRCAPGRELLRELGALDAHGRSPTSGGRWSSCRVHPRLARMVAGRARRAVVRSRRRRRGARRAARPPRLASRRPRPACRCCVRPDARRPRRSVGRSRGCGSERPTSPAGPVCASTPAWSTRIERARRCSPASPTASLGAVVPGSSSSPMAPALWLAADDPLAHGAVRGRRRPGRPPLRRPHPPRRRRRTMTLHPSVEGHRSVEGALFAAFNARMDQAVTRRLSRIAIARGRLTAAVDGGKWIWRVTMRAPARRAASSSAWRGSVTP